MRDSFVGGPLLAASVKNSAVRDSYVSWFEIALLSMTYRGGIYLL